MLPSWETSFFLKKDIGDVLMPEIEKLKTTINNELGPQTVKFETHQKQTGERAIKISSYHS